MKQTGLLPDNFDFESFIGSETSGQNKSDAAKLLIRFRKSYPAHAGFLAEQIKIYSKAQVKLPEFSAKFCLFTSKSYEQASSQQLAMFKSRRFKGNALLDLTGGLGVDDRAFSESFEHVVSLDTDRKLNEMARYNFRQLGVHNITRLDEDAYEFIKKPGRFDLIYLDADRRTDTKVKKAITLHDSEPEILKILDRLFELSEQVLLKLSPLVDITYLARTLKNIKIISVISSANEVKEILVLLIRGHEGETEIEAIEIAGNAEETAFGGKHCEKAESEYKSYGKYLYEPANALIKSGLVGPYAKENGLNRLDVNSLYLIGDKLIDVFFGRKFEIIARIGFGKTRVKNYLREQRIAKANISKRNFSLTPVELKKLFKVSDGGDEYLFFSTDSENNKLMYHCRKVI